MYLDITESNFNETKEIWENNGIKTYDVPIELEDCRIEGNDAIITLRLPHEDAVYTDYASIMFWIKGDDGSKREESRAGFSVPSECSMNIPIDECNDVTANVVSTITGNTAGLAELRINCESIPALDTFIKKPKSITYLRPMWYTGYGEDNALNPDRLTPDNTVVMEDMRDVLECSSLSEGRGRILNGKRYVFTFDEDVYTWGYPYRDDNEDIEIPLTPSYYEIIPKDGTEDFTGVKCIGSFYTKDKLIYSTSGCVYVKMKRMNYSLGDSIGYGPEESDDVLNGQVSEYIDDTDIFQIVFNMFDTDEMININLRRSGLYLVSRTLWLNKSNICIIGHGSQIRVRNPIPDGDGYYVLVKGSLNSGVENVELCDLSFYGLTRYENGAIVNSKEKCFKFQSYDNGILFPINMTFFNVNIDGFETGVHFTNEKAPKNVNLNHRFINCNLSRTMFGYIFKASNRILVSGGSVDNSLSTDKMHHCVYVSTGSSYITVENCTLKNSTGGAIHQMGGDKSSKMEHNRYHHLTIMNCFDGIVIAGYTLDASAKHIRGENIGRFLHLSDCGKVVVKDYFATQLKSPTICVGEDNEMHFFTNRDHYSLMAISNCVDATVVNCYFDGATLFKNGNADYTDKLYCPRFIASEDNRAPYDAEKYETGWVEDGFAIAKIIFRNCRFTQKNEHEEISGKSLYDRIGFNKNLKYSWDFLFDNCEFSDFRRIFCTKRIYLVQGNSGKKSTYRFHNCKAYYGIEEPVGTNDVPIDGFFFCNNGGANLLVSGNYDCYTSFSVPDSIQSHNGTVVN